MSSTLTVTQTQIQTSGDILSLTLHTSSSPKSSYYDPLHRLGIILERFEKSLNDQPSVDLFKWGANVLKDFNDLTSFGAALKNQDVMQRVNQLAHIILVATNNKTTGHDFAQEMDSWMGSLPLDSLDSSSSPVASTMVSIDSERERKVTAASTSSPMSTPIEPSESPELTALKLLAQWQIADAARREQRDLRRAKKALEGAKLFEEFEKQMRVQIDTQTKTLRKEAEDHKKKIDTLFDSAEQARESDKKIWEANIANLEAQQKDTKEELSKETTEKEKLIANVRELRIAIYHKELEMQRIRDQARGGSSCVIL